MEEVFANVTVKDSYFPDHAAVEITTEKNYVDLYINP